jgi:hypothetical protein
VQFGPLSDVMLEQLHRHNHAISGRFAVRLDKLREFLAVLAAFVESTIEEATESERTQLLLDVGLVFVVACSRSAETVSHIMPLKRRDNISCFNCRH